MYRRMLIPLDGSDLAEVVFTYAKELAGRLDLEITLLCVSGPALQQFIPMQRAYIEQAAEIIKHRSQEIQAKTSLQPGDKPIEVRGELMAGYPAEEILRYADENEIDLILMATHGRSGIKRWSMGSVADKVLRESKIPICLIPAGVTDKTPYDQWPRITIIVPLDGSELAESVLPHVKTLAKQRGIESVDVSLLRICEPPTIPAYYGPDLSGMPLNWGEYVQQETDRNRQAAKEYLAIVEKQLRDIGISARSEVIVEKAADGIVDYVNKNPFNFIIMATHGRSGLSRWVYGSITENVLQGVFSPILLVRSH
ncbi:universal stress protein [Chloroflexota bacterium]